MPRYIDADELKKGLKELKAEGNNLKYVQGLQDAIDGYFPQIIDDAPTADVQPVKQWYSVEENQPDSVGDDVLVVDSYGKYHIAYYLSGSENWMNQDTREPIKDVVKWRYLGGDSKWTH